MVKLRRITESEHKNLSWKNTDVQDAIRNAIDGIVINKDKTSDKELVFTLNDKNGLIRLQGYMLILDMDTEDGVPPVNYPVKNVNNLTLDDLISTIRTVFSRMESKRMDESNIMDSINPEEDNKPLPPMDRPNPFPPISSPVYPMHTDPVFHDIAKDRLFEELSKSLILVPVVPENHHPQCLSVNEPCEDMLFVYLSPSYAIEPKSDIVIPISLKDRMVSMPVADMPDPNIVLDGVETQDPISFYDKSVQNYMTQDVPMSDIIKIELDNLNDVKGSVVNLINTMSEDYLNKKMNIEDKLEVEDGDILNESRYFIVPADTDLSEDKEVTFITPLGYTDLSIAKDGLNDLLQSGRYDSGLKIIDTNYSKNKNKWVLL